MNILILNGSPRANGNTAAMTRAFMEGAEAAGHEVTEIQVGRKKIAGCLGCEYCHTKGNGSCVQKDDMEEVYEALRQADMLVFASPVYYFTMSGQLQNAIDRTYAFDIPKNIRKAAMILSSASDGVYEPSMLQYREILRFFEIQDMGVKTAHGEENKSEKLLGEMRAFGVSM